MWIRSHIGIVALVLLCLAPPNLAAAGVTEIQAGGNTNGAGTQIQTFKNSECTGAGAPYGGCTGISAGSGFTTSISQNDCITAFVDTYNNNAGGTFGSIVVTAPSGWNGPVTKLTTGAELAVGTDWWKAAGPSETGDYVFTCTVSGVPTACYPSISFGDYSGTNAPNGACFDPAISNHNTGGGPALAVLYGTPTYPNTMIIGLFEAASSLGGPADLTQRYLVQQSGGQYFSNYYGDNKITSTSGGETGSGSGTVGGIVEGIEPLQAIPTATATATATATSTATATATSTAATPCGVVYLGRRSAGLHVSCNGL
jgi:hypothetical protein